MNRPVPPSQNPDFDGQRKQQHEDFEADIALDSGKFDRLAESCLFALQALRNANPEAAALNKIENILDKFFEKTSFKNLFLCRKSEFGGELQIIWGKGHFHGLIDLASSSIADLVADTWNEGHSRLAMQSRFSPGFVDQYGEQNVLLLPLSFGGRRYGVLGYAFTGRAEDISAQNREILETQVQLLATLYCNEDGIKKNTHEQSFAANNHHLDGFKSEEMRGLLDLMPAVIWIKDTENRILLANRCAAERMGIARRDIEGRFLWELDPENAAAAYRDDLKLLESGQSVEGIIEERIDSEGKKSWWKVDRTPLFDNSGDLQGLIVLAADISKEHLSEVHMERATKAAAKANRIQSRYLNVVGREIQRPLSKIQRVVGRLLEDPSASHSLYEVQSSADSLLSLMKNLLDFSKIEAGNLALEVLDFDPRELLEQITELMEKEASRQNIHLHCYVAADVPYRCSGDATRLRQVLIQLLSRHLHIHEKGDLVLILSLVSQTEEYSELRFELRHSGEVCEGQELEFYFRPFIEGEESAGEQGTDNFGLALSSKLVQLMGGKVGLESAQDEWLSSWFSLKLNNGEEEEERIFQKPSGDCRVLLLSQNDVSRNLLRNRLQEFGINADASSSIDTALEMLEEAAKQAWPFSECILDGDYGAEELSLLNSGLASRDLAIAPRFIRAIPFGSQADAGQLPGEEIVYSPIRESVLRRIFLAEYRELSATTDESQVFIQKDLSLRVLVVDDDSTAQTLTRKALEAMGCKVELAGDGQEALEVLQRHSYDLVVTALQMQSMDGFALTTEIRRREGASRHTQVLALSLRATRYENELALASGIDHLLAKPLAYTPAIKILHQVSHYSEKSKVYA